MKKFNKLTEKQMTRANGGGWVGYSSLAAGVTSLVGAASIIGGVSGYVAQKANGGKN